VTITLRHFVVNVAEAYGCAWVVNLLLVFLCLALLTFSKADKLTVAAHRGHLLSIHYPFYGIFGLCAVEKLVNGSLLGVFFEQLEEV